jgi:hypothetical protein
MLPEGVERACNYVIPLLTVDGRPVHFTDYIDIVDRVVFLSVLKLHQLVTGTTQMALLQSIYDADKCSNLTALPVELLLKIFINVFDDGRNVHFPELAGVCRLFHALSPLSRIAPEVTGAELARYVGLTHGMTRASQLFATTMSALLKDPLHGRRCVDFYKGVHKVGNGGMVVSGLITCLTPSNSALICERLADPAAIRQLINGCLTFLLSEFKASGSGFFAKHAVLAGEMLRLMATYGSHDSKMLAILRQDFIFPLVDQEAG